MGKQKSLDALNPAQRQAVTTDAGYVRIIAGAGSGKTRVLTERIAYLLNEGLAKPHEVLAITFTNKAASEMRERIETLVGEKSEDMWVMTYHAFCARILRYHIHLLDYDNNYIILDASDQKAVMKDLYRPHDLSSKELSYASVLSKISNYKMQSISPDDAAKLAYDETEKLVVELYRAYDKFLKDQGVLDFDDLLILGTKLLKTHPEILEKYANRFKYIHVDEFQDTNDIQYELISLLSSVHKNLYIVGDPDQAIYSWRGANDSLILDFEKEHKKAETITLEQNYRSTQTILTAANRLIGHNKKRLDKNLFSEGKDGKAISVYEANDDKNEADFVAVKLKGMMRRGDENILGNTAVLYRANYLSRVLEEGFIKHQLPYVIYGDTRFLDRREIKDLLSYMQLVLDPQDDIAFKRIINVPKRNVGVKTLERIEELAVKNDVSLFDALGLIIDQAGKGKSRQLLVDFQTLILEVGKDLENLKLVEVLEQIYTRSKYDDMLEKDTTQAGRIENVAELLQSLTEYEVENNETTGRELLALYLQEMALMSSVDKEDESNSVSFMTVHAAKGLEFDNVFILGMNDGVFPSKRSVDEGGMEEERRLAYVAMTRAKEQLFVSYANGFNVMTKESKRPSPFLYEADLLTEEDHPIFDEVPVFVEKKASKKATRMSYGSDTSTSELGVGDKVSHKIFGEGVVVTLEEDRATIAFSAEFGVKTLAANFIEKV